MTSRIIHYPCGKRVAKIKSIVVCIVCMFFAIAGFTQQRVDTITIRQSLWATFEMNGRTMHARQLLAHSKTYDEAYVVMQRAKTNYDIANGFSFAGGVLIGLPVGTAIRGGEPTWALAGVGAGLVAIAIPFSFAYGKHAKRAVRIYNREQKANNEEDIGMDFGLTSQGMTLRVTF